ncbi:MAG: hypothetical protein RRA94_07100 [Bacteroidota bacterium]|nr:hypothetical protein [Bacteroidota bacterium]
MFPRIDKGPIEYRLAIYPSYNTERQRECIRFHFRTAEEFSHFQYNIAIEEKTEGGRLSFALKGLKAKGLLPGVGVAESVVDLFDLDGPYDVHITKPGDIENSFRFAVGEEGPALVADITDEVRFLDLSVHDAPIPMD